MLAGNGQDGGTLNLTFTGNTVNMGANNTNSADALDVAEGNSTTTPYGSLCTSATGNTLAASGIDDPIDGGFDAVGFLIGSASPAALALQGYTGASADTNAVIGYLESTNTLSGHSDPADEAQASSDNSNPPDFTNGTCPATFDKHTPVAQRSGPAQMGGSRGAQMWVIGLGWVMPG